MMTYTTQLLVSATLLAGVSLAGDAHAFQIETVVTHGCHEA